jgi:hypothetical protein
VSEVLVEEGNSCFRLKRAATVTHLPSALIWFGHCVLLVRGCRVVFHCMAYEHSLAPELGTGT